MSRRNYSRSAIRAALIVGLALCLAMPAGADDSDAKHQLIKLEKATAELQAVVDNFRLKQVEMALHLSIAQRQEAKALAGITADTYFLALMLGPANPEVTQENASRVAKLTATLQSALDAFKNEVAQARRFQDEICANAKLLQSDPPPPSGRISGWADRAERLLETSTAELRVKRAALTSAWNALNKAAGKLEINLGRLEALLSRSQDFRATYQRLAGYRTALEAAGKDLIKARGLRKELVEVQASFPAAERSLRGQLQRLRAVVPASAGLRPRIDAALAKLKAQGGCPGISRPQASHRRRPGQAEGHDHTRDPSRGGRVVGALPGAVERHGHR